MSWLRLWGSRPGQTDLGVAASVVVAAAAATSLFISACFTTPDDGGSDTTGSRIEKVDPLEGAYVKQGGTPVNFVFKRGEAQGEKDSFFGGIVVNGTSQRAAGTIVVARDNLGTLLTLSPSAEAAKATPAPNAAATDTREPDAGDAVDAGPVADPRPLVQQAFSGTMHFLKIGKNNTILVRAATSDKTAQYKKVQSWCGTATDCASNVQRTGLSCSDDSLECTSKSACACAE